MDIEFWAATDVGRKRTHNEDNFLLDEELRLFVVADGMGGHASGEVASAMAVHAIRDIVARERDIFLRDGVDDDPLRQMEIAVLLEHAVHVACDLIHQKGTREPEKRGMGTTVVAMLLVGSRGYIAYVGDSRIYLARGGVVYQITEDHSLMNELIRQGKITAEEFDTSPYAQFKHAMTRAVGPQEQVEVDTLDFDLLPGDTFVMCSDGLHDYLDDAELLGAVGMSDVTQIPARLIEFANQCGGKDNITAIVVRIGEIEGASELVAEVNLTLDTLRHIPLFEKLTPQQLVRIMTVATIIPYPAGSIVYQEGDPGSGMFVVLRGIIQLHVGGRRFATLGSGAHFGELNIFDDAPRPGTAVCREDAKLLVLDRSVLFDMLRKESALAVKLLWSFCENLSGRLRHAASELHLLNAQASQAAAGRGGPSEASGTLEITDDDVLEVGLEVAPGGE
jgi:serine/threonine protein phosphatase PrpC/CRP-like cAMP-binding protein